MVTYDVMRDSQILQILKTFTLDPNLEFKEYEIDNALINSM